MNYTQPLTLGEFIEKLKQQPQENTITFDFGRLVPTSFDSWRGSYDELALGYENPEYNNDLLVSKLLSLAIDVEGTIMEGYKGGYYTMKKETRLWADNYGKYSSTAIVDVIAFGNYSKIITRFLDPGVHLF